MLTPSFNPMANILTQKQGISAQNMGLLNAGAVMLANSGYSTTPKSLGQILGQGLLGYQQGVTDFNNQAMQAKLMEQKLQPREQERKIIKGADGFNYFADTGERVLPDVEQTISPEKQPTSIQEYNLAKKQGFEGSFLDFQTQLRQSSAAKTNINNTVGGQLPFKIPANHMLIDPADPSKGVKPIPGIQDKTESAKTQVIASTGLKALTDLDDLLRDESGNIQRISAENIGLVPNFVKSREGQKIEVIRDDLSDLVGRLRSGGAINQDEEKRFLNQLPKFGDRAETVEFKMKRLEDMFGELQGRMAGGEQELDFDESLLEFMSPEDRALFK